MLSSNHKAWERSLKDGVKKKNEDSQIETLGQGQETYILAQQLPWPLIFSELWFPALYKVKGVAQIGIPKPKSLPGQKSIWGGWGESVECECQEFVVYQRTQKFLCEI